jgi:hypothetical protein
VDDLTALLHALHGGVFATLSILGSGKGSRAISATAAQRMQTGADTVGETLVWTVYGSPDKFVARPCMTLGGVTPMPVHLEAPTLEQLRALLPAGLTWTDRLPDDDPRVVETWQ